MTVLRDILKPNTPILPSLSTGRARIVVKSQFLTEEEVAQYESPFSLAPEPDTMVQRELKAIFPPHTPLERLAYLHRHGEPAHEAALMEAWNAWSDTGDKTHLDNAIAILTHLKSL